MRFLVDVCVDVGVRTWLQGEGHDAVHLRDEELQKLPNGEIFVKADLASTGEAARGPCFPAAVGGKRE
jgi:predicted nuclease of predicted toxin-antitoxin system